MIAHVRNLPQNENWQNKVLVGSFAKLSMFILPPLSPLYCVCYLCICPVVEEPIILYYRVPFLRATNFAKRAKALFRGNYF